jgi:hypothetical protein
MTAVSERDVVFTPFMRRVRAVLDGSASAPAALSLRPSELQRRANAVDSWVSLRARAEQVVAEANAMSGSAAPLVALIDETESGELAFSLRGADRWARLRLEMVGGQGFVELITWTGTSPAPLEPVDRRVLEDLVLGLIEPGELI